MTTAVKPDYITARRLALIDLRQLAERALSTPGAIANDDLFVELLTKAAEVLELTDGDIADAAGVSRPTVNRWLNRQSDPHPAMRRPLYKWIDKQAAHKLAALSRRQRVA